jgi:hypothetical protein
VLKSGDPDMINKMFKKLDREAKSIVNSIIELVWYMRGSIQYSDMMMMTNMERELVRDFVKDRMEAIKKHSFPVY